MTAAARRRRSQAGTTLVELVVSLFIAGLALALIVGTLSSGLLNATLAKRNTAIQAVMQYEVEAVGATAFDGSAADYSDCFAVDNPSVPAPAAGYTMACPGGAYSLRADVSWQWLPGSSTVQVWTVAVSTWPSGAATGKSIQIYKVAYS